MTPIADIVAHILARATVRVRDRVRHERCERELVARYPVTDPEEQHAARVFAEPEDA